VRRRDFVPDPQARLAGASGSYEVHAVWWRGNDINAELVWIWCESKDETSAFGSGVRGGAVQRAVRARALRGPQLEEVSSARWRRTGSTERASSLNCDQHVRNKVAACAQHRDGTLGPAVPFEALTLRDLRFSLPLNSDSP
jgi:hypothetical protein